MYSDDEDEQQASEVLEVSENRNEQSSLVTLLAEKWPSTSTTKIPVPNTTIPLTASQEIVPPAEEVTDASSPADIFEERSLPTMESNSSYEAVALQSSTHK